MRVGSWRAGGAALSVRALRAALRKQRSRMLWLILGLMLGSLVSIAVGDPRFRPAMFSAGSGQFQFFSVSVGIAVLLGLRAWKKLTQKREHREQAAFMDQDGHTEAL